MDRVELFRSAKAASEKLQQMYPSDRAIQSVLLQLEYLIELSSGKRSDYNRLNDIIIGILTTREIDQLDSAVGDVLAEVDLEVEAMKGEFKENGRIG